MNATIQLLKKIQLLQELVEKQEEGDEVLERTISKLLHYELEKLKARQNQIREKLTTFEERYQLQTEEFCQKFRDGKMGDDMDFLEWSALAEIFQDISQRVTETEQASNDNTSGKRDIRKDALSNRQRNV